MFYIFVLVGCPEEMQILLSGETIIDDTAKVAFQEEGDPAFRAGSPQRCWSTTSALREISRTGILQIDRRDAGATAP